MLVKNDEKQLNINILYFKFYISKYSASIARYCYTGLSYADIYELTYDDIKPHFDDNLWIMKKRVKTNTDITVPLMDIPLSIIEKYRGKLRYQQLPEL